MNRDIKQLKIFGGSEPRVPKWAAGPSGRRAAKAGSRAEADICSILRSRGYIVHRKHKIKASSSYGYQIEVDLFVEQIPGAFPNGLIVELKWQSTPGSVDEKFHYLVDNIKANYPAPTAIVLDGGGYREGAERWLRLQVDGAKLVGVFSYSEFVQWLNQGGI